MNSALAQDSVDAETVIKYARYNQAWFEYVKDIWMAAQKNAKLADACATKAQSTATGAVEHAAAKTVTETFMKITDTFIEAQKAATSTLNLLQPDAAAAFATKNWTKLSPSTQEHWLALQQGIKDRDKAELVKEFGHLSPTTSSTARYYVELTRHVPARLKPHIVGIQDNVKSAQRSLDPQEIIKHVSKAQARLIDIRNIFLEAIEKAHLANTCATKAKSSLSYNSEHAAAEKVAKTATLAETALRKATEDVDIILPLLEPDAAAARADRNLTNNAQIDPTMRLKLQQNIDEFKKAKFAEYVAAEAAKKTQAPEVSGPAAETPPLHVGPRL